MELVLQWSRLRMFAEGAPYDMTYDDENDYGGGGIHSSRPITTEDDEVVPEPEKEKEKIYRACDTKSNLYILQQELFIQGGNALPSRGKSSCSR